MTITLTSRPRRNRVSDSIRSLVRENNLQVTDLIMPLFIIEGTNIQQPVASMPGISRLSLDLIVKECQTLHQLGVPAVVLFPALDDTRKDTRASESANANGLYQRTITAIKAAVPEMTVMTDVAMDPYSSDGHDGYVLENGVIDNDITLPILAEMSVSQARAGADIIAPSDMMDGRVGYIREALDDAGFTHVGILAYSAKFASAYYGPFREALESAPKHGDKKTYQMDPANVKEAIREALLDIDEGADMVMVKPGLPYLDVIRAVSEVSEVPVAVYNVSGEYAMVKAAGLKGWIDYKNVVLETLLGFKRAGASMILSYSTKEAAEWLNE
ncbi:MAG: porphobilinogen synthase [Deltaproteobacteria bacterium]|jgi:porphobilinogen synthase|nr:porphobilinogen synthase [Deltaproteobacteria bacterium]MBT4263582.1 porphobilinogen synthase [Deltaproteobacteria bacterium]MBT4644339.1 porphobilinogen synthase [Deltaproteobacteria bacterium]MBT6614788.1 porphobilinogen synthase [Deltaproteobacteria bacterium]MBT7152540.1 porphobilinogen synthase [Deltaproteobacteria bacterium]